MADAPLALVEVLGNAIVGGMEVSVRRLLRALPRADFRAHVVLPREGALARALRDDGHDVTMVPLREDAGWSTVHQLAGVVERAGASLLHAHLPNAHALAALAGLLTSTPVAATIHSMHVSLGDLEAHRLCDSDLICVSRTCATHAVGVGLSPARVHVVRNAAPAQPARRRSGDDAPFAVAWIGRLSAEKNPELFVRAAARLRDLPRSRFVVVGEGPLGPALRQLARSLGVGERIEWRGDVPDASAIVATFDAVVSTSWHEGTPLALLEAMAAGVPVVATAVGGVPEIVVPGENGLLVSAGDVRALVEAIRTLCPASPAYRPLAGPASAPRTFEAFVAETADLLRTVAGRSTRIAPHARRARGPFHERENARGLATPGA